MKIAFIVIGIIMVLSFAVALIDRVLNFGNFAGMLLGAGYILLGVFFNRLGADNQILVSIIALCLLLLIILLMGQIYADGRYSTVDEEVVIVLGCKVKGDRPSLALLKRTDEAYKYLLSHPRAVAVLSGGQGRDELLSEALCMKNMLTDRGIAPNRLIMEDKSTNTDENIRFSLELMAEMGLKREVAIATSRYHQKRAKIICKRYGIKATSLPSHTKWNLLPTFLFREIFALIKEKSTP